MEVVVLKVRVDCEGCRRKVYNAVAKMKGVETIEIDMEKGKVTVMGVVEPNKVLMKVREVKKYADFWTDEGTEDDPSMEIFDDENRDSCTVM